MWPASKTGKWLTSRRPHVSRAFFFVPAEDGLRLHSNAAGLPVAPGVYGRIDKQRGLPHNRVW